MGLFIGRYVVSNVRKGRKPTPTVTSQNMTPTIMILCGMYYSYVENGM